MWLVICSSVQFLTRHALGSGQMCFQACFILIYSNIDGASPVFTDTLILLEFFMGLKFIPAYTNGGGGVNCPLPLQLFEYFKSLSVTVRVAGFNFHFVFSTSLFMSLFWTYYTNEGGCSGGGGKTEESNIIYQQDMNMRTIHFSLVLLSSEISAPLSSKQRDSSCVYF